MSNPQRMNLNYLLNNAYYKEPNATDFLKYNRALTGSRFQPGSTEIRHFNSDGSFCLKTTYPGLLIGLGNTHDAGTKYDGKESDAAEIKLGFTLDFVTGLPVIPGSMVKGALRGAFKYHDGCIAANALESAGVKNFDVKKLKIEIFGTDEDDKGVDDSGGTVAFFDAVPVRPDRDGRLFGLDNITPHPDPLKSPIPLTMLKVIPNVVFLFRFGFERWNKENDVTPKQLKNAFETIITTLGVGAKTNVGFGVMESTSLNMPYYHLEQISGQVSSISGNSTSQTVHTDTPAKKAEGVCKWDGCEATTRKRPTEKGGGYDRYCYRHYVEMRKNQSKGIK